MRLLQPERDLPLPGSLPVIAFRSRRTYTSLNMPSLSNRIPLWQRILVAVLIGILSGGLAFLNFQIRECIACDFTTFWRAARHTLAGENPYVQITPSGPYPYDAQYFYPLTAALAVIPFALFPAAVGGALFFGLSAGILALALLKEGWQRLPIFLSAPFLVAAAVGQWSVLFTALTLLPGLQSLITVKPNLGLAAFLYRPTWKAAFLTLSFIGLSLLVRPDWPLSWWQELQDTQTGAQYRLPILSIFPISLILLASAWHWRKPEGRLLLALALVRQNLWFYDQLQLFILPRTWNQSWAVTFLSWIGYGLWRLMTQGIRLGEEAGRPDKFVLVFCYLPALGLLFQDELQAAWKKTKHLIQQRNSI
jgi:hypothetical protein